VGVDRYSNWPTSIKSLPIVGGGLDPNIEAIAILKPDVVLAGKSTRATDRLRSLGIKVLTFDVKDYRSAQLAMTKIALLLGLPDKDTELLWQNIIAQVSSITASLPKSSQGTRVYFEVSNTPFGAGEASFIGETLSRLKVTNIIPASLGPFPKLNPEFIVRENPNLIMLGYTANENLSARPGWNKIQAVSQQRICTLLDPTRDPLGKGFHIIQGMIAIGSGGFWGKGFMQGTQTHLDFIPERTTDFVFAAFSEEFGLVGNLMLIGSFAFLILRGLAIAVEGPTLFARLLAGSVTLSFFIYAFVNMGMVSGMLPVVGVPLPFISYGGTAMVTLGLGLGILMSVAKAKQLVQS
jgi:ABC-type hemin transport system substrate-binding protein